VLRHTFPAIIAGAAWTASDRFTPRMIRAFLQDQFHSLQNLRSLSETGHRLNISQLSGLVKRLSDCWIQGSKVAQAFCLRSLDIISRLFQPPEGRKQNSHGFSPERRPMRNRPEARRSAALVRRFSFGPPSGPNAFGPGLFCFRPSGPSKRPNSNDGRDARPTLPRRSDLPMQSFGCLRAPD
jgi:hypothetical protein